MFLWASDEIDEEDKVDRWKIYFPKSIFSPISEIFEIQIQIWCKMSFLPFFSRKTCFLCLKSKWINTWKLLGSIKWVKGNKNWNFFWNQEQSLIKIHSYKGWVKPKSTVFKISKVKKNLSKSKNKVKSTLKSLKKLNYN